jgi:outer membrane protein, heavy metal efflux system
LPTLTHYLRPKMLCALRRRLLACALASLSTAAWSAPSLQEVLDLAWQRAVEGRIAEARRAEATASRIAAESLFPQAPSIGVSQRSDHFNQGRGFRERELELALPLWLPGQQEARLKLAAGDSADSLASIAAARLALAGELRARLWDYASAHSQAELASHNLSAAEALEQDVARREAAGELARTDLLQAREDTLDARRLRGEARLREQQALERYRLLTGVSELPAQFDEPIAVSEAGPHPRLQLAIAAAARARAQLQLTRESTRDAPELSIGWQQSRDSFADPNRNSLRIGLRIPFASSARNAPLSAAANTSLLRAEAEQQQILAELESAQRDAQAQLDNAEQALTLAQTRSSLVTERLRLQSQAFTLGELSLAELLRTRKAANKASLEARLAALAVSAARANLNQAMGVMP